MESSTSPLPVRVVSLDDLGRTRVREFASLDLLLASGDFLPSGPAPYSDRLRVELRSAPQLSGFAGPMWDGGALRYESWRAYDRLSS